MGDVLIHDSADKVPPRATAPARPALPANRPSFDPRLPLVGLGGSVLLLLLATPIAYGLDWLLFRDCARYGDCGAWPFFLFAVPVLALAAALVCVGALVLGYVGSWRQANVLNGPENMPIHYGAISNARPAAALYHAAAEAMVLRAERSQYGQLSTMSISAPKDDGKPAAALLPGDVWTPPALVPDSEWLNWFDQQPHCLVAGRTNAGKTTTTKAAIGSRVEAGELVLFLDPHDQPGKWYGVRAIGGGREFGAILDALDGLMVEHDDRYDEYSAGKQTEEFDRLTIVIDEAPAIVGQTMDGTRVVDKRWRRFAKNLGSEARKVRMSVILLSQSPLVEDLQINSVMRENFTRIALGDQVSELAKEERDPKRRAALLELVRGAAHPAAMEYRNEVHVLDTRNVQQLAQRGASRIANLWLPPQRSAAATGATQPIDLDAILDVAPQPQPRRSPPDTAVDTLLRKLIARGLSNRKIGEFVRAQGISFDQNRLTELRQQVDEERNGGAGGLSAAVASMD